MAAFEGLGRALRWVRQRQGKKQYEVAATAKITKAMLSSYENEKQRPAIETLERILGALEIDLDYLAYAMRMTRADGEGAADGPPPVGRTLPRPGIEPYYDLERVLGLSRRLEPAEERAVAQMLEGFHSLLGYMLGRAGELDRRGRSGGGSGPVRGGAEGPDEAGGENSGRSA